ncbi:MAG: histidine kinase [Saprospiraceae bacterium]|nr:histidine kinase [Saprospiraceae bacterium]
MSRILWVYLFLAFRFVTLSGQSLEKSLQEGETWEIEWVQQRHLSKDGSTIASYPLFPDQLKAGEYDMRIGLRLFKSPKQGLSARITSISYIELPQLEPIGKNSTKQAKLSQPIFLDTRFQDAYFNPQLFLFDALLQHDFPISCKSEVIDESLSNFSNAVNQTLGTSGLLPPQLEWLQKTELAEAFSANSLTHFFCQLLEQEVPAGESPFRLTTRHTDSQAYIDYLRIKLPAKTCVFRGQILNRATDEIRVKYFRQGDWHSYWQDSLIQLDKDGFFELGFPLAERRIISISHGYQSMRFYLEPGDTLQFQTNANAFYREMSFEGKGVSDNQFLLDFYHQMRGDTLFRSYDFKLLEKEPIGYFEKIKTKEQAELAFLESRKARLRPELSAFMDRLIRMGHATTQWEAAYRFTVEKQIELPRKLIQDLQALGALLYRLPRDKTFDFDVEEFLAFQYHFLTQIYQAPELNSYKEMHLAQLLLSKETFVRHTAMQLFRSHGQLEQLTRSRRYQLEQILAMTRDSQLIDELMVFTRKKQERSSAAGYRILRTGIPAPDWTFIDQESVEVGLKDFRGKQLLLHIGWDDLLDVAVADFDTLKEQSTAFPTVIHLITAPTKEHFSKSIAGLEGLFIYVPEEEMTDLRDNYRVDNRTNHYFLIDENGNIIANHLALGTAQKLRGTWAKLAKQAAPTTWTPEQRLQFWQSIGIGTFILLLISGGFLWQRRISMRRDLRRRQLLEVELRGIRSQMNPHFLFNAMSSIQNLIRKKEQEKADVYLGQFAGLMRKTLRNTAEEYIPLSDEIDTLEQYCSLESLRHPFTYEFLLEETIDAHNTYIPSMILQPIIENAILHGLTPIDGPRELSVKISPALVGLHCEVVDNGIGLLAAQAHAQNDQHKSYGMKLVRQRLDLLGLESDKHFSIQDRSQLTPPSRGTLVTLTIPTEQ